MPAVMVLVVWSLTTHGKFSDSGDEPHYLIVSESLVADGDLDLSNNYADGDGRWFGADDLQMEAHARPTRRGPVWTTHDIGVPVVLAPIYALATRGSLLMPDAALAAIRQTRGLFAYSIVSLFLIALTSWGVWLVYAGLRHRVPEGRAAVVALGLGLSPPILSHAFLVFPETLAAVVMCGVVWAVCVPESRLTPARVAGLMLAVGCLPWLHRKYAPLEVGLAVLVFVQLRTWIRARASEPGGRGFFAVLLAAAIVPQLALHAFTFWAWGSPVGPQLQTDFPFSAAGVLRGGFGLAIDRERGLLGYAPIYLLLPACAALTWRRTWPLAAVAALLYAPMAAFNVWGAGFSPAARYLVPLMPLAAVPMALALDRRAVRLAAVPLAAFQVVILVVVWNNPRLLWPEEVGTNAALEQVPVIGRFWEHVLPSLWTGDAPAAAVPAVAVAAGLLAAVVLGARRERLQTTGTDAILNRPS